MPAWGDPAASILFAGLAPAAHGANRTGRMFTGDRSGDFLYAALYRAGWASRPESRQRGDGLRLTEVWISAAVRCAPPANRPTPDEFDNCRGYLRAEIAALPNLRVIVALGQLAHAQLLEIEAAWEAARRIPAPNGGSAPPFRRSQYPFAHGREHRLPSGPLLLDCYHPSQQNTFTGKLTAAMMDAILHRAAEAAAHGRTIISK